MLLALSCCENLGFSFEEFSGMQCWTEGIDEQDGNTAEQSIYAGHIALVTLFAVKCGRESLLTERSGCNRDLPSAMQNPPAFRCLPLLSPQPAISDLSTAQQVSLAGCF